MLAPYFTIVKTVKKIVLNLENCFRMSGSDIKQSLRKLDYPICAREALCRIG